MAVPRVIQVPGTGQDERFGRFEDIEPLFPMTELLSALSGSRRAEHPIACWCVDLLELHQQDDVWGDGLAARRTDLMHAIDVWTVGHVPQHRNGARLHTETVGSVVDRIARAYARFQRAMARYDAADPKVHAAWTQVAELFVAYQDLIVEVMRGQRRLPAPEADR
ncbi:DUF4254 domain-containing protein [Nocardia sp. NPDC050697]|uniref:DUF4254 domain-containing protein n=1 Tax=Nocardia sp. NPDC050697 TaxID=3155158 RepID=UPI0033E739FC